MFSHVINIIFYLTDLRANKSFKFKYTLETFATGKLTFNCQGEDVSAVVLNQLTRNLHSDHKELQIKLTKAIQNKIVLPIMQSNAKLLLKRRELMKKIMEIIELGKEIYAFSKENLDKINLVVLASDFLIIILHILGEITDQVKDTFKVLHQFNFFSNQQTALLKLQKDLLENHKEKLIREISNQNCTSTVTLNTKAQENSPHILIEVNEESSLLMTPGEKTNRICTII